MSSQKEKKHVPVNVNEDSMYLRYYYRRYLLIYLNHTGNNFSLQVKRYGMPHEANVFWVMIFDDRKKDKSEVFRQVDRSTKTASS